jgi:hypothetical protein
MKWDESVTVNYVGTGIYDVLVRGDFWGRVAGDSYTKCYRQSDDRYVSIHETRDLAIQALLDSVEKNFKN